MRGKCVLVREDDPELARLVSELLEEDGYTVVHVRSIQDLLVEAVRRAPCLALIDSTSSTSFDLWWLGPVLSKLGVPPLAFTAHASAEAEFQADHHDFVGIVGKPFETDAFVGLIETICWESEREAAAS